MRGKRCTWVLIAFLALAFAALAPGISWAKGPIEWRCDTPIPDWRQTAKDYMAWADRVNIDAKGDLIMTVYPGGALGFNMRDILRILKTGMVQASLTAPYYLIRDAAPLGLLTVQGTFKDRKDYLKVEKALQEVKTKIYAKWNVIHLGQFCADDSIVCLWTNKPVKTLEDMKGMKIRCWDKFQGKALTATGVGISTPTIAQAEMYMAMKTGVVDGVIYPPKAGKGLALAEIAKYATVLYPYADCGADLLVAQKAWDSLSPELREILVKETREWEAKGNRDYLDAVADEKAGRAYCDANGVTFSWLPEPERARITQAAFKVWKEETDHIGASWVYEKLSGALAR